MSTTLSKRDLATAEDDAATLRAYFFDHADLFDEWHVAGSVRRRCAKIGDVEHVIIPKIKTIEKPSGLFGEIVRTDVNVTWGKLDELLAGGVVTKHLYGAAQSPRWGDRYRGVDFRGFCHEFFRADQNNLGSVLAIRTGPAEFSQSLVVALQKNGFWNNGGYVWDKSTLTCPACGWSKTQSAPLMTKDWGTVTPKFVVGNGDGLLCPTCRRGEQLTMTMMPAPDEKKYFELCGVKWIRPEDRR